MPIRDQLAALSRIAWSQATAVRNLARGWPLVYTGTAAMTLDADDLELAAELLAERGDWTSLAPIEAFEREFAEWNGSRSAFAFASGRVALAAAITALELRPGDEVVVPGYTCVVVTNALRNAGLKPIFADIELDTYGLDKDAVLRAIGTQTKAVLIHHLYGFVSRDLDAVLDIARARRIPVIEDCAQSTGAAYNGRKVGNFGNVAIFSCDPSKPFTCIQGGLAVANDERLVARLADIRRTAGTQDLATIENRIRNVSLNYAVHKDPQRWWKADVVRLRDNTAYHIGISRHEAAGAAPLDAGCRMAAPLARLASHQLRKLDYYNARRRANCVRWDAWCETHDFAKPLTLAGSTSIALRYPVMVTPEMKNNFRWAYRTLGVVPGSWFITHLHPAPEPVADAPNAARAVAACVNFPTLYFEDRWRPGVADGGS
jgi:dTDP-4-amino-4,6-dideoxygalactose transaminase